METGEDVIILFYTAVQTRKKIISFSITYNKLCLRFLILGIKMKISCSCFYVTHLAIIEKTSLIIKKYIIIINKN